MPSITLTNSTLVEGASPTVVVGNFAFDGGKQGETFQFMFAGIDAPPEHFAIVRNGDHYELIVDWAAKGSFFDFENPLKNSFTFNVFVAGNMGTTFTGPITVKVTDVNEAPTDLTLTGGSVAMNAAVGTEVAALVGVDQDYNETFTYEIVANEAGDAPAANPFFALGTGANANKILLKSALGEEQFGEQALWIKTTDSAGHSIVKQVTLTVTEPPPPPAEPEEPVGSVINGTPRNDKLYGTAGADVINGLAGNDQIFGLAGDDIINGGAGKDKLYGGAGKDTFVFDTPLKKGHFDRIYDFNAADDTIQFDLDALKAFKVKATKGDHGKKGIDDSGKKSVSFDKLFKKGKLDSKYFSSDTKLDSNDYIYYNKKNGIIYLDVDGSGKAKGIEIVQLKPNADFSRADFIFV